MPDKEEQRAADRLDRLVEDTLRGRRSRATASDAGEREAIRAAASLAGSRESYPRMRPDFKRRLEHLLEGRPEPPRRPAMTRRTALFGGLGVAVGATAGAVATRALEPLVTPIERLEPQYASTKAINPSQATQKWVDVGIKFSELEDDKPVLRKAGAVSAYVVRRGNMISAMSAFCTHLPCELKWVPSGQVLNCPCHNANFNLNGESQGSTWPTLPAVSVRVTSDGRVEMLGTG